MNTPPTPAMVIDAGVVASNVKKMSLYAAHHGLSLRPHTKTHKSLKLARLQVEHGARGLTVAKVGECAVMASATDDLLVGYPAWDAPRAQRIAELARDRTVHVAVDSKCAVESLSSHAVSAGTRIGILIDLDVGFHRTGMQSPGEAQRLAEIVDRTHGVELRGLFFYPGHLSMSPEAQSPHLESISLLLDETLALLSRSGLSCGIVSGGSTPTAFQSHQVRGMTEIRPGTYIYNDMNTVRGGFCAIEDCAARIVCTVVSNAVPGKVVLDAGSKTLTSDRCGPAPDSGHGHIAEYPEAKITRLSEEHGEVDISACERLPRIGERVTVIPNHICPCVNLQDSAWWKHPDGTLEPLRIDARGLLS